MRITVYLWPYARSWYDSSWVNDPAVRLEYAINALWRLLYEEKETEGGQS